MTDVSPSQTATTESAGPPTLTPHCRIRTVEAVVNEASGSVGAGAAEALEQIVSSYGLAVRVAGVAPKEISGALERAVAAKPDLLIVLAGDGTARSAAELAGPTGPFVAPLPGGTMNVLPKAFYGERDWRAALHLCLSEGMERPVSGGCVDGRQFFVAAILGSPALWAPARESVRSARFTEAALRALRAWRRAFSGSIHYRLDGGPVGKAEAVSMLCPLISKAMDEETALEAAVLTPSGAAEAFRLAFRALWGGWRADPAVQTQPVRHAEVLARGRIPAILDGETVRLPKRATVEFRRVAFRALAPAGAHPQADVPPAPATS